MKKLTTLVLSTLALTSFSFATINYASAVEVPQGVKLAKDQTYYGNLGGNPTTLDPSLLNDTISNSAASPVFETLVRQQEQSGKYIPAAAESWTVSPDGLTWTFKLRQNAKWQDGKPVTAQDFLYSWRRLCDPKTASYYGNYLQSANVVNAGKVFEGKLPVTDLGVDAPDPYTLVVHLTQPTPWLPQMLSYVITAPLRKDLIEKYGDKWTQPGKLIGNGPFKLDSYVVNDSMNYSKADTYWDAKNVVIQHINFIFLNDTNSAYLKYLSNELDITSVPPSLKTRVLKERPNEVITAPVEASSYIGFNVKRVPYAVRRAVTLLVDSKFLTKVILKSGHASSILTPTYVQDAQLSTEAPYFNQSMEQRRQEALKVLKEAGYSKSHPFELDWLTTRSPTANLIANAVRSWLDNGSNGAIKFKLDNQEVKIYFDKRRNHEFDAFIGGWGADYDQASTFYNILRCTDPNNESQWCSPVYDATVKLANKTVNADERAKLYAIANLEIQQKLPIAPLFWQERLALKSPALGGYNPVVEKTQIQDLYIIADKKVKR